MSRLSSTAGAILLGLCFAFSLARVLNYSREQSDPDKTIVRYAHYIQEESVQAGLRAIADAYEKDHPDVSIREVVIPRAVYNSWVQTKLVGKMATDLILLDTIPTREQVMFNFSTLNEFMGKPNPYNRGTELEGVPWRETFVDHLVGPPNYWDSLAAYWGVPLVANTIRVIYNRDLLRQIAGDQSIPRNYTEFIALCEKVRDFSKRRGKSIYPIAVAGRESAFISRLIRCQTLTLALRCDSNRNLRTFYSGITYLLGRWSLDEEEIRLGLQLAQEVCGYMQPGFFQQRSNDTLFYFGQERALMILADSGTAGTIKQQVPFAVGAFEIPLPDQRHPRYGRYLFGRVSEGGSISRWSFGLTRQSRHPEIALDFLHYLTSRIANERFAEMTGNIPSVVGAAIPRGMEAFAPKVEGYPQGIDLGSGTGTTLFNAHFHRLLSPGEGIDAFLDAMRRDYLSEVVRNIHSKRKDTLRKIRFQDVDIAAKWLAQSLNSNGNGEARVENLEQKIGLALFNQVHFESDQKWHRLGLIAGGHPLEQ